MTQPYKCPVCDGTGLVSKPPWTAGDHLTWSTVQVTWVCPACNGERLVWGKTAEECIWIYDDVDDKHDTSCGEGHCFLEGGVAENKYIYCPYCGGKIQEKKEAK